MLTNDFAVGNSRRSPSCQQLWHWATKRLVDWCMFAVLPHPISSSTSNAYSEKNNPCCSAHCAHPCCFFYAVGKTWKQPTASPTGYCTNPLCPCALVVQQFTPSGRSKKGQPQTGTTNTGCSFQLKYLWLICYSCFLHLTMVRRGSCSILLAVWEKSSQPQAIFHSSTQRPSSFWDQFSLCLQQPPAAAETFLGIVHPNR